jgi:hypothetical protein
MGSNPSQNKPPELRGPLLKGKERQSKHKHTANNHTHHIVILPRIMQRHPNPNPTNTATIEKRSYYSKTSTCPVSNSLHNVSLGKYLLYCRFSWKAYYMNNNHVFGNR